MKPELQLVALSLRPARYSTEFSAAAARVLLLCSPDDAVGTASEWLEEDGWVVISVLRSESVEPEDWAADDPMRALAERAADGAPQILVNRVCTESWRLDRAEGSGSVPEIDVDEIARSFYEFGGWWITSDDGAEAIHSPNGALVLPLWPADKPPQNWSPETGELESLDVVSILELVLTEVDDNDALVGICAFDQITTMHPLLLLDAMTKLQSVIIFN